MAAILKEVEVLLPPESAENKQELPLALNVKSRAKLPLSLEEVESTVRVTADADQVFIKADCKTGPSVILGCAA